LGISVKPARHVPFLRAVIAELHEADLGDLIAALEPDGRVSLIVIRSEIDRSAGGARIV
jgi:hypothetical protein